jgi:ferrous iron transport protein B
VLLHPILGWLILGGLMTALFATIFSVATVPMDWIDAGFGWTADWIKTWMSEGDLRDLLTDGVLAGVGSVVMFLPQILLLFFFIGLLEDTGYMARVAFIMDRLMGLVGLNGRAFIPLLSSYACAIPGIMATRTIANPRERLITILVAPLASCSARLPVYVMMIGVMLPSDAGGVWTKVAFMLGLYALGTVGMFLFAWLFHRRLRSGTGSTMILELPLYKVPALRAVLLRLWSRARVFITQAGTVILVISILLWAATSYPKPADGDDTDRLTQSIAGQLGKQIEPLIEPLGYDWKMGIGLIASFAAREVFVSTMSILYRADDPGEEGTRPLQTILREQKRADGSPLFNTKTCLSMLVFYVFAMQCMATLAITRRETNSWKWPLFQFGYLTVTAYLAALLVYQGAGLLGY